MKKQGEPLATFMAFTTLFIIGKSAKKCMRKYSNGGNSRRLLKIRFR